MSNSKRRVVFSGKEPPLTCAFGCVWVPCVTKTLQYDEFNAAASCKTITSGFTLRFCCFQCSQVGVESTVLTHVTISRWRWALATFKKSCYISTKQGDFPYQMAQATHREKVKKSIKETGLQINHNEIFVWVLLQRVNEILCRALAVFMCPDTSNTSFWWVHTWGHICQRQPGGQMWQFGGLFKDRLGC